MKRYEKENNEKINADKRNEYICKPLVETKGKANADKWNKYICCLTAEAVSKILLKNFCK